MKENNNTGSKLKNSVLEFIQSIIVALILAIIIKTFIVDTRVVPSGSMLPTIQLQDRVLVLKSYYTLLGNYKRGDIIVFTPPPVVNVPVNFLGERSDFVKRLIGLPGETLEVKNSIVYINGKPLAESYLTSKPDYDFGPVKIPQGKVMVFGDNRNDSYDSHMWGFLNISSIKGKAFAVYWPVSRISWLR